MQAAKAGYAACGQVGPLGNQTARHAQGDDEADGRIGQEVAEVVLAGEIGLKTGNDDGKDQNQQDDDVVADKGQNLFRRELAGDIRPERYLHRRGLVHHGKNQADQQHGGRGNHHGPQRGATVTRKRLQAFMFSHMFLPKTTLPRP